MVLAVDAGHHMNKSKVTFYMLLTIIGGAVFVGSQAWEWKNFIKGEYGALETKGGQILQFINADNGERVPIGDFSISIPSERSAHKSSNGLWYKSESALTSYSVNEVVEGFQVNKNLLIRIEKLDKNGQKIILTRDDSLDKVENAVAVVEGANLIHNEYGNRLFADFFFFITGFHGFHVFSGVVINVIIFFNVIIGTYERRGHYEMVEKVGLYWHFVDLVWVFVFTFFYLV
jgi:cytochrome c oxidase subunit 3